ncbi:MAG: F0F1 ATP synthase subunit B [Chthoniobacterales bacterium]
MESITQLAGDFGVTWVKLISQAVLFLVVYLVLNKFAFGPIIAMLEERRKRIEEGQLNADKIKKQLAESELRYQEALRKANEEAQHIIDEARTSTEITTQKQLQQAITEAEEIVSKARVSIEQEREKMVTEVRKEMVSLVVDTTARVTGKVLTPEDQARLNQETTKELAA